MRAAYVYYRIDPACAGEAAKRIDALLRAMAPWCANLPRRLRRCDDEATWMEIYEGLADWEGFLTALHDAVGKTGVADCALDGRHLECFVTADLRA